MNYAQLRAMDISNGTGIRVSLFVSGCSHNCKACFNQDYQDFTYGKEMTFKVTEKIISLIKKKQYKGLTLIGGEPFQNLKLIQYVKPIREFIDDYNKLLGNELSNRKDIWIYSGYTLDQILSNPKRLELLKLTDVLVDGLFVEELLNLKLKFRGSSNQRILDVKKSLAENKPIYYYETPEI